MPVEKPLGVQLKSTGWPVKKLAMPADLAAAQGALQQRRRVLEERNVIHIVDLHDVGSIEVRRRPPAAQVEVAVYPTPILLVGAGRVVDGVRPGIGGLERQTMAERLAVS